MGQSHTDDDTGLTAPVSVSEGGTGATTPQDSRASLGLLSSSDYSGGVFSGLGTSTFSYTAGVGYITTGNNPEPATLRVDYLAGTSITPLFQVGNIFIDSSGALIQRDNVATPLSPQQLRDDIFLGLIVFFGETIIVASNTPSISIGVNFRFETLLRCIGGITCSGNVVSPNGANLQLNRSAGTSHRIASNFIADPTIPDETVDTIDTNITDPGDGSKILIAYQSASPPGFNLDLYTGVEPDSWDDGGGIKATVSVGKWTVQRLFFFNTNETYLLQLGQTEYNMFSEAVIGIVGEQFVRTPDATTANLICSIVVKAGETDLTSGDTLFKQANKFGEP